MKPKQISKSMENIALFMTERFLAKWSLENNEKVVDVYSDELTMRMNYLFHTKLYTIRSKDFDIFVRKTKSKPFSLVFAYHPPNECWIRECLKIKGTIKHEEISYDIEHKPETKEEEKALFQAFDELEQLIRINYKGYGDIID